MNKKKKDKFSTDWLAAILVNHSKANNTYFLGWPKAYKNKDCVLILGAIQGEMGRVCTLHVI